MDPSPQAAILIKKLNEGFPDTKKRKVSDVKTNTGVCQSIALCAFRRVATSLYWLSDRILLKFT